jgi:hypothetical protein
MFVCFVTNLFHQDNFLWRHFTHVQKYISYSYYCQAILFPSALGPLRPAPCLKYFVFFIILSFIPPPLSISSSSSCCCCCCCTCSLFARLLVSLYLSSFFLSFFLYIFSIFFLLNSFVCTHLSETYGLIHVSLFYQDISKVTCTRMDGYSEHPGLLPPCGGIRGGIPST